MSTERLYYTDPTLLEFTASIAEVLQSGDATHIVLDRTAFYPTGGGQPNDTGLIDGVEIVDVAEDDDGKIMHVARPGEGAARLSPTGRTVKCSVDAPRRLDHMQQHTGQHILSQAFVQACGAETRSFHLGAATSTIDIELQNPSDEHMRAAEEIANRVVFEDRQIRIHIVSEADAANLPLRKESAVRGTVRVIEIDGFDWSPCGGTHASRAGQVGLIAIKSFERAKKMTRVEFVCGWRALADYRLANHSATAVARQFSVDRESAPGSVEKTIQENKSLRKRVRDFLEIALNEEASRLHGAAPSITTTETQGSVDFRLVRAVLPSRDVEELRILAHKILERGPSAVLLGTSDGSSAKLVFARSAELPFNMGSLLGKASEALGGRGGGKPDMAQGGGPRVDRLEAAIEQAAESISGEQA